MEPKQIKFYEVNQINKDNVHSNKNNNLKESNTVYINLIRNSNPNEKFNVYSDKFDNNYINSNSISNKKNNNNITEREILMSEIDINTPFDSFSKGREDQNNNNNFYFDNKNSCSNKTNNNNNNFNSYRFSHNYPSNVPSEHFINLRDSLENPNQHTNMNSLNNQNNQNAILNKQPNNKYVNTQKSDNNSNKIIETTRVSTLITNKNMLIYTKTNPSVLNEEQTYDNYNNNISITNPQNKNINKNSNITNFNENPNIFKVEVKAAAAAAAAAKSNQTNLENRAAQDYSNPISKKSSSSFAKKLSESSLNSFTEKETFKKMNSKVVQNLNQFIIENEEDQEDADLENIIFKNLKSGGIELKNIFSLKSNKGSEFNNFNNLNNYNNKNNNFNSENENDKTVIENLEKFDSLSNKNLKDFNEFLDFNSPKSDNLSYISKLIERNKYVKKNEKKDSFIYFDEKQKAEILAIDDYIDNNNSKGLEKKSIINLKNFLNYKRNSFKNKNEKSLIADFNRTMDNRIFLSSNSVLGPESFEPKKTNNFVENKTMIKIRNQINFFNEHKKNNSINNNYNDKKPADNIRYSNNNDNNYDDNNYFKAFNIEIENNNQQNRNSDLSNMHKQKEKKIINNQYNKINILEKQETKKIFNFSFSKFSITNEKESSTNFSKENEILYSTKAFQEESNYKISIETPIISNASKSNNILNNINDCKNFALNDSKKSEKETSLNNLIQSKEYIKQFDAKKLSSEAKLSNLLSTNPIKQNNTDKDPNKNNKDNIEVSPSSSSISKKHQHLKSLSNKISNTNYVNKKLEKLSFSRNSNKARLSIFERSNYDNVNLTENNSNSMSKSDNYNVENLNINKKSFLNNNANIKFDKNIFEKYKIKDQNATADAKISNVPFAREKVYVPLETEMEKEFDKKKENVIAYSNNTINIYNINNIINYKSENEENKVLKLKNDEEKSFLKKEEPEIKLLPDDKIDALNFIDDNKKEKDFELKLKQKNENLNSLFNLDFEYKFVPKKNNYLQCKRCTLVISTAEISIKHQRKITISLLSLKEENNKLISDLLSASEEFFKEISLENNKEQNSDSKENSDLLPKFNIDFGKYTKENFISLKEENLKLDSDVYFIVHKMEGRAFILGRNGFYNKTIELLKKNNCFQIYFVFVFKNETEEEMKISLDNLIKKGDQKELEFFMNNNQIIYINESYLENKDKKDKLLFFLSNSLFKNFFCLKSFENIKMPVYSIVKNFSEKSFDNKTEIIIEDSNNKNIISAFYNKFKRYLDDNIYYKADNYNYFDGAKNFYIEKNEILEKLKFIKIFQKFSKEKLGDNNSNRFNCDIL